MELNIQVGELSLGVGCSFVKKLWQTFCLSGIFHLKTCDCLDTFDLIWHQQLEIHCGVVVRGVTEKDGLIFRQKNVEQSTMETNGGNGKEGDQTNQELSEMKKSAKNKNEKKESNERHSTGGQIKRELKSEECFRNSIPKLSYNNSSTNFDFTNLQLVFFQSDHSLSKQYVNNKQKKMIILSFIIL